MKKIILSISTISILTSYANASLVEKILEETNEYRKYIHNSLVNSAYSIDNYYFEERNRNIDDYNNTYALLELSTYYNEEEKLTFKPRIKVKLNLPNLKDKFKLVFESEEDRDSNDYIENHTSSKNNDYNLSLLYNKALDDSLKFKTKLGLKLDSGFNPFVKIELKKLWLNNYYFDYIFSNSLKQSIQKKLEYTSYLEISKKLNETFTLHNYNEYYWNSPNKENSAIYNSLYLNHKYDIKNYLTYQIDMNTDNNKTAMKTKRYSFKLKYRHYFKNWFYVDLIPENYYRRDNDFKSSYALKFNLGLNFNKHSYN